MRLVTPAPAVAPKLVPRKRTVAPAVLAILAAVNIVEPPVPELRVTVEAPDASVRAPMVSLAAVAATLVPLNTNSPPLSVSAKVSLMRPPMVVVFAVVLSSVSLLPKLTVNAELTALPPVPLRVSPPALTVVAPV